MRRQKSSEQFSSQRALSERLRSRAGACAVLVLAGLFVASTADAKFRTLHRSQVSPHADVALNFVLPDDSDFNVLRTDVYGEFAVGNFGVFMALPFTSGLGDALDGTALGNIELGIVGKADLGPLALVGHLGVAVPSAGDDFEDVAANLIGGFFRIEDTLATVLPDTTTLRLGLSPRFDVGVIFLQGDVGIDIFVDSPISQDAAYHLAAGVGANILIATATVEIVHAELIDAGDADTQSIALSLAFNWPLVSPFVSYSTLIGNGAGDVHTVSAGATIGF